MAIFQFLLQSLIFLANVQSTPLSRISDTRNTSNEPPRNCRALNSKPNQKIQKNRSEIKNPRFQNLGLLPNPKRAFVKSCNAFFKSRFEAIDRCNYNKKSRTNLSPVWMQIWGNMLKTENRRFCSERFLWNRRTLLKKRERYMMISRMEKINRFEKVNTWGATVFIYDLHLNKTYPSSPLRGKKGDKDRRNGKHNTRKLHHKEGGGLLRGATGLKPLEKSSKTTLRCFQPFLKSNTMIIIWNSVSCSTYVNKVSTLATESHTNPNLLHTIFSCKEIVCSRKLSFKKKVDCEQRNAEQHVSEQRFFEKLATNKVASEQPPVEEHSGSNMSNPPVEEHSGTNMTNPPVEEHLGSNVFKSCQHYIVWRKEKLKTKSLTFKKMEKLDPKSTGALWGMVVSNMKINLCIEFTMNFCQYYIIYWWLINRSEQGLIQLITCVYWQYYTSHDLLSMIKIYLQYLCQNIDSPLLNYSLNDLIMTEKVRESIVHPIMFVCWYWKTNMKKVLVGVCPDMEPSIEHYSFEQDFESSPPETVLDAVCYLIYRCFDILVYNGDDDLKCLNHDGITCSNEAICLNQLNVVKYCSMIVYLINNMGKKWLKATFMLLNTKYRLLARHSWRIKVYYYPVLPNERELWVWKNLKYPLYSLKCRKTASLISKICRKIALITKLIVVIPALED